MKMTEEYKTILTICREYPGVIFRNESEYHQGDRFGDPYLAIKTPGRFTVHEIKRNGLVGQPVGTYSFEEVRHAA